MERPFVTLSDPDLFFRWPIFFASTIEVYLWSTTNPDDRAAGEQLDTLGQIGLVRATLH